MTHASSEHGAVAIIGGGAAGMSCALWLRHLGFTPIIIDQRDELGGQLLRINRVNQWVLGMPHHTSPELASRYARHVLEENIQVNLGARLSACVADGKGFVLMVEESDRLSTSLHVGALVVATGMRVKTRDALGETPGFESLYTSGRLSFFPIDHLEQEEQLQGKIVAVIGGGDNAHFTVNDVAPVASRTHLLIRSRPNAQRTIRKSVEALIEQGVVTEHQGTEVAGFQIHQGRIQIALTKQDCAADPITVDRIFARTGFAPNTEFLEPFELLSTLRKDADGYLMVDQWKRTSVPRVYAIGDVSNPKHPAVVTAIADGAIAARAIAQDLGPS